MVIYINSVEITKSPIHSLSLLHENVSKNANLHNKNIPRHGDEPLA